MEEQRPEADGLHPLFKAFLKAVLHQKRERFLPRILVNFGALLDEAEAAWWAVRHGPQPLPPRSARMLEQALSSKLGRQVTLKPYSDKSLLGGAVLRIGDTVYDASLRGRLGRLGRRLVQGPHALSASPRGQAAAGGARKDRGKAAVRPRPRRQEEAPAGKGQGSGQAAK